MRKKQQHRKNKSKIYECKITRKANNLYMLQVQELEQ